MSRFRKYFVILVLSVILLPVLVAIVKIAVCKEGIDDCVQLYVKELKEGRVKEGYVYSLNRNGETHMDKELSYSEMREPIPVV